MSRQRHQEAAKTIHLNLLADANMSEDDNSRSLLDDYFVCNHDGSSDSEDDSDDTCSDIMTDSDDIECGEEDDDIDNSDIFNSPVPVRPRLDSNVGNMDIGLDGEENGVSQEDSQEDDEDVGLNREDNSQIPENAKELTKIATFKSRSCCQKKCVNAWNDTELLDKRITMMQYNDAEKNLIVLGSLSSLSCHDGEDTYSGNWKKKRKRERTFFRYQIDNHAVCRDTFCFLMSIGQSKLNKLKKHYLKYQRDKPADDRGGHHDSRAFNHDDVRHVVSFLDRFGEIEGLNLPGRVPGYKQACVILLPSAFTMSKIHTVYEETCNSCDPPKRPMSLTTFRKTWKLFRPNLLVAVPRTDLCVTCQKNMRLLHRSANSGAEQRLVPLTEFTKHLEDVKKGRQLYRDNVQESKKMAQDHSVSSLGRVDAGITCQHYSFDFAQNWSLPYNPQQPGPIFFETPRKVHLFGVCCEGVSQQVNYIIDEALSQGKGSEAVISYLHHFFEHYSLGEDCLCLHCDNCVGQNKNKYLIAYLSWRVMTGKNKTIKLNFMTVGHTKFAPDLNFGVLKKKLRRTEANCLTDMANAIQESSVTNVAQLCGLEDCSEAIPVYAWKQFFKDCQPVKLITKQRYFEFTSTSPGMVTTSTEIPNDLNVAVMKSQMVLPKLPEGFPEELPAPGLSDKRKKYLYDNIRHFVSDECKDILCPPLQVEPAARQATEPET